MNFNDFVFILLPATGTIPKEKVLYSCFALFWITFSVFSNKRHYRRWIELFCSAFHLHFKMEFSGKLYQSNKTLVFFPQFTLWWNKKSYSVLLKKSRIEPILQTWLGRMSKEGRRLHYALKYTRNPSEIQI